MKFIKPDYEIMQCPDGKEVLRFLEEAARTCYKSEDKAHRGVKCDCQTWTTPQETGPVSRVRAPWSDPPKDCAVCKGTGWAKE
ncbi:unnamed protein product, partial [marine sediment metagenome]